LAAAVGLATLVSVTAGICAAQPPIEYPVPTSGSLPDGIAAGPDGNLWFTESNGNKIAKISPAGVPTEYPVPTLVSLPYGIVAGPDGNLWFTEYSSGKVGKISTAGVITEYVVPTTASQPSGIAAGPDENLWFTEFAGNKIGRITTAGVVAEFTIPSTPAGANNIAKGPDGNVWFTEGTANRIGKIASGTITEYIVPTSGSNPAGIVTGPDGNLWFTESQANQIGKITTSGVITEYVIPTSSANAQGIAAGPDGNLWFTEFNGDKLGKITTGGTVTEYPVQTSGAGPFGIAVGPDGNLWFTEYSGDKVAMVYPYGQAFAHLAIGPLGSDVWTTAIILNNTGGTSAQFTVNFIQDNGQPLPVGTGIYNETHETGIVNAQNGQYVAGTLSAKGTVTIVLSSSGFLQGWATLSGPGITGQVVFHRHTSSGAEYEATVPLALGGTEYLVPYDATSYFNGTTQVTTIPYITGVALANLDPSTAATINCTVLDPSGANLGSATPIVLPPMGHRALQLNAGSGFGLVAGNIGTLDCSSGGQLFSVLGLRFLGGNDLTSFAATKLH